MNAGRLWRNGSRVPLIKEDQMEQDKLKWQFFLFGVLCGGILMAAVVGSFAYFEPWPETEQPTAVTFHPGDHVMHLENTNPPNQWYVLYSTVDGEYVFIRNYFWVNLLHENEYNKWVRSGELRKVIP
jgi:hypothetical protein